VLQVEATCFPRRLRSISFLAARITAEATTCFASKFEINASDWLSQSTQRGKKSMAEREFEVDQ